MTTRRFPGPAEENSAGPVVVRWRYGLALLAVLVTVLAKGILGPLIHPNAVLAFLPAVWLSAWLGGTGPGLLSTALCTLVGAWLFPPAGGASGDDRAALEAARLALFVTAATTVTWLTARYRTAVRLSRDALAAARRDLEARVAGRTGELTATNARLRDEIERRAAAESQFRNAFEHAPFGMALVGLDGRGLRINAALAAMLGYKLNDVATLTIDDVQPTTEGEKGRAEFRRLVDGEIDSYRTTRHLRHRSGRLLQVQVAVSMVRDARGRPVHAVCHLDDLTEQLDAERALRESEGLFRSVAEASPAGISIVQNGRFVYLNATAEQHTGYSQTELLGKSWFDLMETPAPIARLREWMAEVERRGSGPLRTEVKIRRRDGEIRWIDLMATGITYRGTPARLSVGYDVTDRVRAETALRSARDDLEAEVAARTAALRASEARWRGLVEHLNAITYVRSFDPKRQPPYVSPQAVRYLGITPEQAVADSRLWETRVHPEDRERVLEVTNRARTTGEPVSLEHRMVSPDGTVTWFAHEVREVVDDSSGARWWQGIMLDVTARKQAEGALVEMQRLTLDLLENLSEGFMTADLAGVVRYVNPSGARLLRCIPADLIGKEYFALFPGAVNTVFYQAYERVRDRGAAVDVEGYSPPFNRWYRMHLAPSSDGLVALYADTTERHEREVGVMSDVLGALNGHVRLHDAFPSVAAGVQRLTGCAFSALCVFDREFEWVRCIASAGDVCLPDDGVVFRCTESRAAPEILAGRPFVERDIAPETGNGTRWLNLLGLRSRITLPLRGRDDVLGMLILAWRDPHGDNPDLLPLLLQISDAVALAVEKQDLYDQVRVSRERLQALSQRLLEVQEFERRHLARELHDEIGQTLTGLRLQLEAAAHECPDAGAGPLARIQHEVDRLLARVRGLALDLRPAMLDDLGLLPALLWLLERYEAETRIRVRFEHRDVAGRRFGPGVETAAYRIVQEALTNVARHARVVEATVRAWAVPTVLGVQIVDTGAGFDVPSDADGRAGSAGLGGMRERALLLGGTFAVESQPGRGTTVSAEFPVAYAGAGEGA